MLSSSVSLLYHVLGVITSLFRRALGLLRCPTPAPPVQAVPNLKTPLPVVYPAYVVYGDGKVWVERQEAEVQDDWGNKVDLDGAPDLVLKLEPGTWWVATDSRPSIEAVPARR